MRALKVSACLVAMASTVPALPAAAQEAAPSDPPPVPSSSQDANDAARDPQALYERTAITVRAITVYGGRRRWTEYRPSIDARPLAPAEFFTLTGDTEGLARYRRDQVIFGVWLGVGIATSVAGVALGAATIIDRRADGSVDQGRLGAAVGLFLGGNLIGVLSALVWPLPFRSEEVATFADAYNARLRGRLGLPPAPSSSLHWAPTTGPTGMGAGIRITF